MSYIHLRDIHLRDSAIIGPLPFPVVKRYLEEGGDSVSISPTGHAILARRDTYGFQLGQAESVGVIPALSNGTSSTDVLLALAQHTLLRGQRLKSDDSDLLGIIYRAMHDESIIPVDEVRLRAITESHLSQVYTCPVSGCSKDFMRRDDLVKHIRRPGVTVVEPDQLRLHNELDAKYQGLELNCCGETHKTIGTLLKHIQRHSGT